MFSFFKSKDLNDYLNQTKVVKIDGIKFKIKKISPLDYLDGSKVLQQVYTTYQQNKELNKLADSVNEKKIREHFSHVLVAGVVSPKLGFKENEEGSIFVERIFVDWNLAVKLYQEIIAFTYGKKKL